MVTRESVRRGDTEWEGMDGIPIVEMFSGGTESTTWTVHNAYVEYSYASVDRGGDMADPVPRAAFVGDVEVTEYREYTTFQAEVGLPVGGPPGSRSGDPTAELDIGIPIEHTVISAGATYSVRLLQGNPVPVGRPATRAPRTYYRQIPLTRSRLGRRGLTVGTSAWALLAAASVAVAGCGTGDPVITDAPAPQPTLTAEQARALDDVVLTARHD